MIDIVIFSSDSFMPRTNVCVESCKKFIPEAKIHVVPFNNEVKGDYISGLAKARLEYTKKLLEEGSSKVMILGADCVFYARPDEFLLSSKSITLIPHVINPPMVNGAQLYKTGHVNADMMLFYYSSLPILEWLVKQDMKDDSANGIFYEQTWLSALPFFFEGVKICNHPGINFAYFNFHERQLTKRVTTSKGNEYFVDMEPLVMVQFSGFEVEHWYKLSKHFNGQIKNPLILELFKDYKDRIK
jgi:hypothetical protein